MRSSFYNPLAYPAGYAPGFDPTHPASNQIVVSSIAMGKQFVCLAPLGGLPFTTSTGATGPVDGVIGPMVKAANGNGARTLAGLSVGVFNSGTAAFIGYPQLATINRIVQMGSSSNNAFQFNIATTGSFQLSSATTISGTTGVVTTSVPCFAALSWSSAGVKAVFVNLSNGQIFKDSFTLPTIQQTGQNGICSVGTTGAIQYAASMCSFATLSAAQLLQWAADPWSFWYPRQNMAMQ